MFKSTKVVLGTIEMSFQPKMIIFPLKASHNIRILTVHSIFTTLQYMYFYLFILLFPLLTHYVLHRVTARISLFLKWLIPQVLLESGSIATSLCIPKSLHVRGLFHNAWAIFA